MDLAHTPPAAIRGLRALVDCGTLAAPERRIHLDSAAAAGFATRKRELVRGRWRWTYSLTVDRQAAVAWLRTRRR